MAQAMSSFLKPYESGLMQAWPVSAAVNKASNQGKQLIEPIAATCAARGHMQQGVANKENRYKLQSA